MTNVNPIKGMSLEQMFDYYAKIEVEARRLRREELDNAIHKLYYFTVILSIAIGFIGEVPLRQAYGYILLIVLGSIFIFRPMQDIYYQMRFKYLIFTNYHYRLAMIIEKKDISREEAVKNLDKKWWIRKETKNTYIL